MVTKSWVAKYNKMKDRKPGVYAIRIMQEDYYDELDAEDDEGRKKKAKKRKSKSSQFKQPDKYSDDASGYYSEDEDEDDDDDMFWWMDIESIKKLLRFCQYSPSLEFEKK